MADKKQKDSDQAKRFGLGTLNQLANFVVLADAIKEDFAVQNTTVDRGCKQIASANRDHFDAGSRDGAGETRFFRILFHIQWTLRSR